MAQPEPKFVTGSTMRHVTVMALTGSLGMVFMFLVDAATLFWIGRLRDETMMAAVGYAGNVLYFALSGGIGLMIATVVLVSRNLGAGNRDEARRQVTSALIVGVALQSAFALLIWLARDPILHLAGAEGGARELGDTFLTITLLSLPAMSVGMITGGVLRAVGDAKRSMYVTLVAGAVAMVLDPVVIVWMDQGVPGAAWVWALARLSMAVSGLYYVLVTHKMAAKPDLRHAWRTLPLFVALAFPLVLTQLSTPFGNFVLTSVIANFGDAAVAAWAVAGRLYMLAFAGLFALAGAIGGIMGQNLGARQFDRVESTFRNALVYCAAYTAVAWALLMLGGGWFASAFGVPDEGRAVISTFVWTAGTAGFTGALFVSNVLFNTVGKPIRATGMNWLRDGLLLWPLAMVMSGWFGAPGVIYAMGTGAILVGVLGVWLGLRHIRSLKGDAAGRVTEPLVEPT